MLDDLKRPIADLLAQYTVADYKTIQDQLASRTTELKAQKAIFDALMERKFGDQARQAFKNSDKSTGTVKVAVTNLVDLKVEVDKEVVWDQTKTMEWLRKQTLENAQHYGKLEVSIPEAKFKAAPPSVQTELKPFRTIKAGKMKFTFSNTEAPEVAEAA